MEFKVQNVPTDHDKKAMLISLIIDDKGNALTAGFLYSDENLEPSIQTTLNAILKMMERHKNGLDGFRDLFENANKGIEIEDEKVTV